MLSNPSWSVRSLLPGASQTSTTSLVTSKELRHLLRLSALPEPASEQEERELLNTLESQLQFVQEIQKVDTEGVTPLRAIRDETLEATEESTVRVEDLKRAFAGEKIMGRNGRIKREKYTASKKTGAEDWDPLKYASRTIGRYYVVQKGKD